MQPVCIVDGTGAGLSRAVRAAATKACECSGAVGAYTSQVYDGGRRTPSSVKLVGFRRAPYVGVAADSNPGKGPRLPLTVLPLRPKGVSAELSSVVDDLLLTALHEVSEGKLAMISPYDVEAILDVEQTKDLIGCDDVSCAGEIAGAFGSDRVLVGTVARLGRTFVVSLSLIDSRLNTVLHRQSDELGTSPEEFMDRLMPVGREVYGKLTR